MLILYLLQDERINLIIDNPPMEHQVNKPIMEPINDYLSSDAGSDSEAIPAYAVVLTRLFIDSLKI